MSDAGGGGATVEAVSGGGPAASAGLQIVAVIVAVGDMTVVCSDELST
jgi:S1-C subfamily serine protease